MKKTILLLCCALAFAFVTGCKKGKSPEDDPSVTTEAPASIAGGHDESAAAPAAQDADPEQMAAAHSGVPKAAPEATLDFSGIAKPDGGHTVEEIFTSSADLSGKEVVMRGKVAKFSKQIMGKNWLHLQDGTGGPGTNDLTITTSGTAAPGDTVLIRGVLSTDKDFGYGYNYAVIVEDAEVTKE